MGSSEILLDLVHPLKMGSHCPEMPDGIEALETYYKHIAARMSGIWQMFGTDACLHGLNALSAYQPFMVRPRTRSGVLVTL